MVGLGLLGTCKWLRLGLYKLLSVVEDCISVVRASLLFMRTRENLSAKNSAVHLTRSRVQGPVPLLEHLRIFKLTTLLGDLKSFDSREVAGLQLHLLLKNAALSLVCIRRLE